MPLWGWGRRLPCMWEECPGQEKSGKKGSWQRKHEMQYVFDSRIRRPGYCFCLTLGSWYKDSWAASGWCQKFSLGAQCWEILNTATKERDLLNMKCSVLSAPVRRFDCCAAKAGSGENSLHTSSVLLWALTSHGQLFLDTVIMHQLVRVLPTHHLTALWKYLLKRDKA